MLEYLRYMPNRMIIGAFKIPRNSKIIGSYAVRNSKNNDTGALIQFPQTGRYCIFCAGAIRNVDPEDVQRLIGQGSAVENAWRNTK